MLRRAGPSLRHFLLERKNSAGYSSYSGEVLNAQCDCFWPAAWSLAEAAVAWSPGELTAQQLAMAAMADRACQEKPHWYNLLCTHLFPGSLFKGNIS